MKQAFLYILLAVGLIFTACDDDDGFQWDPQLMHYDGVNANAPNLPPGQVELAAQFGESAMTFYEGMEIEAVQIFIYQVPSAARLVIYGNGPGDTPGEILYQEDIEDQLEPNGWNIIELNEPLALPSDEIWVSVLLPDGGGIQIVGCDAGPSENGGDWMYEASDQQWRTFQERSTDDINWNIRCMMR